MVMRKVFFVNNLLKSDFVTNVRKHKNAISAGGCVFYKITSDGKIHLLLSKYHCIKSKGKNKNKHDDFGGKVETIDDSIIMTIARETAEETNNVITKDFMIDKINNSRYNAFYTGSSKYYFVAIKVDETFFPNTELFGMKEEHSNADRQIMWIEYDRNNLNNLACRLSNNKDFIMFLNRMLLFAEIRTYCDY